MSSFVDETNLHVKGGDGGAGSVSFRRESHVPEGGPDGGDGAKGGDVWLVADHNVSSLLAFKDHPHRRAGNGTHGQGKRMHGKSGTDTLVPVPEGTVVRDQDGTVLVDLVRSGQRWLAAAGGRGGHGNARFLSNRRRAPSFAEQGEVGEERWLRMELKLMADVALVGFPNVGKSTLISAMSAAKPKIADYPFTTLEPNLGVVRVSDDVEYVVADIPGLVEGAAEGKGLGHQFLRHVERARVLCILLDLAWNQVGNPSPTEQERVLLDELGRYQPDLLDRPRMVIGSRADIADDGAEIGENDVALAVSGATGANVRVLTGQLATLVTEARAALAEPEAFVVHRPVAEGFSIERVTTGEGGWVVVGRQAERAVALSDLTNLEALGFAQNRLKSMGVDRALARAGAMAGDVVRIGTFTFEYEPDETVYEGEPTPGRAAAVIVVAKIGTSSITDHHGDIDEGAIAKFCTEVAGLRGAGHQVVAVTSGAIAAGLPALGLGGDRRPADAQTLQAVSAVGQSRLMRVYDRTFGDLGLVSGQVLLAPLDFGVRQQYLHARATMRRLLELGVVPIVNENDAVADDEIRFGDNDRLAALVAHLVGADTLVLLTDTPGLLTADPRLDPSASLIEEIMEIDAELEGLAGGAGTVRGSGGMASKIAAAKIAAWSGVRAVIAAAHRDGVLGDAVAGVAGVGTVVQPRARSLPARKLWIAFAVPAAGRVLVDAGAQQALTIGGRSLLPAGVVKVDGRFDVGDAVEVCGPDGTVFAKGLVAVGDDVLSAMAGRRTHDLPEGVPHEMVHRDDLVVLP